MVSQSFDGQLVHPDPPAAPGQHLGHERQPVELTALVERGQDLGLAAHLDDLADAQVGRRRASRPSRRGRPCPRDRAQHDLAGCLRAQFRVGPPNAFAEQR